MKPLFSPLMRQALRTALLLPCLGALSSSVSDADGSPASAPRTYPIAALSDHLLLSGRSQLCDGRLTLDWSLAKVEFSGTFDAAPLSAVLSLAYGSVADLLVVIDDDFAGARKITLTSTEPSTVHLAAPSAGHHRIRLIKANQARAGGIDLHSLTLSARLDAAPAPGLRLHIIGDSISCGAGAVPIDRDEGRSDTAENSYGGILMQRLDADVSVVAVSGWGIACGGKNYESLIPRIYDRVNHFRDPEARWHFPADQAPDAIVIALGTNDYRFHQEGRTDELIRAAERFLTTVRACHPQAPILWVYGQMLNQYNAALSDMIARTEDPRIFYADLPKNTDGGYNHPSRDGHLLYADRIEQWLKDGAGISSIPQRRPYAH